MKLIACVVLLAACANADAGTGTDADAGARADGDTGAGADASACESVGLVWRTANKTTYTSYPEPGSRECVEFSGCEYQGMFAACDNTMPEAWVESHDVAAVFPLGDLALHDLCIRAGDRTMIVTVVDTCGDDDCDGCCTENRGEADLLIDLESYTNERWSLGDGAIEWADLGPTADQSFDGCN